MGAKATIQRSHQYRLGKSKLKIVLVLEVSVVATV
jgi:hypothetical protein